MARRRANISMVQNVRLIWLDNNIDEENDDCSNTIKQLRCVINAVNTFTDRDQCINFVLKNNDDKICMIISDVLGQHVVPMVHDMSQVDSIFIFRGDKKRREQWVKEWPKIKGIFTEITSICEALKQAVQECEHNAIGISFMPTNGDLSKTKLDDRDCSFMYTRILKEILLSAEFEEEHIKEFIDYCREVFADNTNELNNIKEFEQKYRDETPIWWYTSESFLYPMLNRALRNMNMDITIKMGFFLGDLHRHIQKLHSEQFGDHHKGQVFTVYRGQGLSKIDFEQMMNTQGGLISFNSFLFTSKTRNASLDFARCAVTNPDLVGILFVMTIDPSISSTSFASIKNNSRFQKQDDEVLFSMHTVFRIREIKQMDETNRLWQVKLTLTPDNDLELCALTERMPEATERLNGWDRLGQLLITMGQPDKARQVYEFMLQQSSNESEETKANILHQLGWAIDEQGNADEALLFYKNSLEIRQKILAADQLRLASSYTDIGLVYMNTNEYTKALLSHEKAHEIYKNFLPPDHPDLGNSYNNIGMIYKAMGEYSKAFAFFERAVNIGQASLPINHPKLENWQENLDLVKKKL